MADTVTQLNPGVGGDYMDESLVSYPGPPNARKRARVVLTGDADAAEIARVASSDPSDSDYGLVVRQVRPRSPVPGTSLVEFGLAQLVPDHVEDTIVSYTVPSGSSLYLLGFTASGDVNARYVLYVESDPRLAARTTAAGLNVAMDFLGSPLPVAEGGIVSLRATHAVTGVQADFDGTLVGYVCDS